MADLNNSIIQKYLDNQFIKIETEGEIQFVQDSVTEVKALISGSKLSMISATLVVLDPSIKSDALIDKVDQVISGKWSLFKNKNKAGKATTIIRAVLLEAIDQIVKDDIDMSATVWLTAANMFSHSELDKESKLFKGWLDGLGDQYLAEANNHWGIPTIEKGIIRADRISKQIEKTIAESFPGMDKYNAAQNYAEWKKEFISGLTSSFSAILAKQFGVKELADTQNALNQRNQLLWLKESAFSFSLNKPYQNLAKKSVLPLVLAYDISRLASQFVPPSVHAFMGNLIIQINGSNPKIPLKTFFEEFSKSKDIKALLSSNASVDSRSNIVQFLSVVANDESALKACERIVGLKDATEFTYSELASWLLNDLLSIKDNEEV